MKIAFAHKATGVEDCQILSGGQSLAVRYIIHHSEADSSVHRGEMKKKRVVGLQGYQLVLSWSKIR